MTLLRRARAALPALFFLASCASERVAQSDVVLVSVDTLRPDHLGCYGYPIVTSPAIDRVARRGTLFQDVHSSSSWTLPAHAALFTSLYDSVHLCNDMDKWLDPSRQTLAEVFRASGRRTVGLYSGPYLHPLFGFARGFGRYVDCTGFAPETVEHMTGARQTYPWGLALKAVTNPTVLREAAAVLAERGPLFLFVHVWDVHGDYIPPPPYGLAMDPGYEGPVDGHTLGIDGRPPAWNDRDLAHFVSLYDGEILATDAMLGSLWRHVLRRENAPILAIVSDHGEAFFEHGLAGHRRTLHPEETHIAFLLVKDGVVPAGRLVPRRASIIDVAPTLLDLARAGSIRTAMGQSLLPAARGEPMRDRRVVSELTEAAKRHDEMALRDPRFTLGYDRVGEAIQVYDPEADPGERHPLHAELPFPEPVLRGIGNDISLSLRATASRLPTPAERPPLSDDLAKRLQSLGYVGP